jgi:glycosyltransferase involved in cell wall biosynthesis
MNTKRVLFFYNNFYPAWKAGGPVQSLTNLANALSGKIDIRVICSGYELNETSQKLEGISFGKWNNIIGTQTYYLNNDELSFRRIKELINESGADIIYLNGLYSLIFVVYPLLAWKLYFKTQKKLILSPRGMLQHGALKVKPFKKKIFLNVLKLLGLHKNIQWHATDEQEIKDIKEHFGDGASVLMAPNIPKKPLESLRFTEKEAGRLCLIYLSLIVAKKNLHLALEWIKELDLPLIFDIYGPVKDKKYWDDCLKLIENMPVHINVKYMGDVTPLNVQDTFLNYHALLLPTKGENFGHAIYECLSVGRPVIISDATPWKKLKEKNAGFDIPNNQPEYYKEAIAALFAMNQLQYNDLCDGAHKVATGYWNNNDFESAYLEMFN